MNIIVELIAFAFGACALCGAITGIFLRWATKNSVLDFPNERSSHVKPTPRGGGVGIVAVVLAGAAVIYYKFSGIVLYNPVSLGRMGAILVGAFLIIAVSWMDDKYRGISPVVRLFVHILASGLAVIGLGGWTRISFPIIGRIEFGWIGIPFSLLWIVSLVNIYNFMDGIDGIAGVQAITAAGGWFMVGVLSNNIFIFMGGIVIGFSAIGFLIFNWPPAKIFMGDIGSAFLGFIFAVIPLAASRLPTGLITDRIPVAGFLMVAPFVADATFTLLRRILRKEKLSQAHRSHLYQRLVLTGLSHRKVTLLYFAIGLLGSVAGAGYIFISDRDLSSILVVGAAVTILSIPLFWVTKREHVRANHPVD